MKIKDNESLCISFNVKVTQELLSMILKIEKIYFISIKLKLKSLQITIKYTR